MGESKVGLISNLVFGIGGLIIVTIISFLIASTLLDSNLLGAAPTFTQTVTLEHEGWINDTDYQLGLVSNSSRSDYDITGAQNGTTLTDISEANITLDTDTGILTNATAWSSQNVTFNYTFVYTNPYGSLEQKTSSALGANFTKGVDNVSSKLPTILLIAAVVILFGVIVLLIIQSKRMGVGSGGSL